MMRRGFVVLRATIHDEHCARQRQSWCTLSNLAITDLPDARHDERRTWFNSALGIYVLTWPITESGIDMDIIIY